MTFPGRCCGGPCGTGPFEDVRGYRAEGMTSTSGLMIPSVPTWWWSWLALSSRDGEARTGSGRHRCRADTARVSWATLGPEPTSVEGVGLVSASIGVPRLLWPFNRPSVARPPRSAEVRLVR